MKLPEIEISLKYKGAKQTELTTVKTSRDAAQVFRQMFNDGTLLYQEEFILLCLNQNYKVIGYYKVSKGGMTATVADVRIIATIALNCAATHVMIAHNHPSGNTRASEADKQLTTKVKEGLSLLDIKLLDHIILTDEIIYHSLMKGFYNIHH